ncbi:EAL domain-containing protein [Labrenzia sp. PHM005]|uniref:sensor domain-containing protein n=1 Tax=Labrenzia sp. PHM005 TaxID=2590016 RepID=UPI0011407CBD|nr:EAL domain-containing protein [Labrenzia sp. PHM005]QDG78606.1 EAL domain-containing protein [Labrenzia sp. PHM005]
MQSGDLDPKKIAIRLFFLFAILLPSLQARADVSSHLSPDLETYYNALPNVILIIDPATGKIAFANEFADTFYGYGSGALATMRIQDINQLTAEQVAEERRLAKEERRNYFIFRHKLADGNVRTVEVRANPLKFGDQVLLHSIIRDITGERQQNDKLWHYQSRLEEAVELKRQELAASFETQTRWLFGFLIVVAGAFGLVVVYAILLTDSRRSLRHANDELRLADLVFRHANEGILVTDADGVVIKANSAVSKISGVDAETILGKKHFDFASLRKAPETFREMQQQLAETGEWSGELWNSRPDGQRYAQNASIAAIKDSSGSIQNYIVVFSDITELKAHQNELEKIAHYDPLTELPNRVLLRERLSDAIERVKRDNCWGAVFFFDLDGFKEINDRYGHELGDQLLTTVSKRFLSQFRSTDTVARLGGDEFIAVVSDYETPEDYKSLAERVLTETSKPIDLGDKSVAISTSVGIAAFSATSDTNPDQLLRQSDSAMYQSKLEGKNRYTLFNPKTEIEITTFNNKINELSEAIDNDQLVFHFQPKVDVISSQVHSAEALVRWNHPEEGLKYPGSFLDATENIGVSLKLDTWALEETFKTAASWRSLGLEVPISVNVDPRNLTSNWLYDTLKRLLAEHETIAPSLLDIEVLENATAVGNASVAVAIKRCQELGVSFSIDDFGTGYSTLTHLRHLPADHVKIDQTFVRAAIDSLDDLAIVDAVLGLAGALNREVIAEGVETKDHQNLLISLGTSILQGYSIARPLPLQKFLDWTAHFTPDPNWGKLQHLSKRHAKLLYLQVELRNWTKILTGEKQIQNDLPYMLGADQLSSNYWPWLNREGAKLFGDSEHFTILSTQCEHLMNQCRWHADASADEHKPCSPEASKEMAELASACLRTIDNLLLDNKLDRSGTIPFVLGERRA